MDKNFYDNYWKSNLHIGAPWPTSLFNEVMGVLKDRRRVLDYGCGLGSSYQKDLASIVKEYVPADLSEVALSDATAKGFRPLKITSEGKIGACDNFFDGATCIEVFEHLYDPLASAKEIFRTLKPGGVIVATVPNFGYLPWRIQALIRARVPSEPENAKINFFNGVHIRYFNTSTFRKLLRDAGFTKIKVFSFDESSIWDIFWAFSYLSYISFFVRNNLPSALRLRFLQNLLPGLFAYRIRAVAYKTEDVIQ